MKSPFFGIVIGIFVITLISSCAWKWVSSSKINGVSLVAPSREIVKDPLGMVLDINANWVAITPYAFINGNTPAVSFERDHQWWGERKEGIIRQIEYAHNLDLKVMLKPHVWVRGQGWAGDHILATNEEWDEWGKSYAHYILTFAEIADSMEVEMLCIGTEYRKAVTLRPDIWRDLIGNVRDVYNGKVIYAANWDNYKKITFWNQLDYVGIDAYFPLSESKRPDLNHLKNKWDSIAIDIQKNANKWGKSIVFTEFGYQSIDFVADGHWKHNQDTLSVNLENQSVAYQAIFEVFWDKPWFEGGFLWKWHLNHNRSGGEIDKAFTPQNKPAQKTISDWYGQH